MDYRIEKDTIGEIKVASDKYWGAQTERSKNNFKNFKREKTHQENAVTFSNRKTSLVSFHRHD